MGEIAQITILHLPFIYISSERDLDYMFAMDVTVRGKYTCESIILKVMLRFTKMIGMMGFYGFQTNKVALENQNTLN